MMGICFTKYLINRENDMELKGEAPRTNDDNVTSLVGGADPTSADGMFELFIQCKEAGNLTEAHKWLRKAAELGHCRALNVACALADPDERLAFTLKAAELGCDQAQYDLGLWYLHYMDTGHVPKDYIQAAFWLTKAAEQGNMDAQLKLGKMYLESQGVPQDDDVAVAWIRKSAEQDHEWALCQLGWMYLEGRGVPQSDKEAAAFFLKAAKLGDFDATYQMGMMYLEGRGVPQDDEQACYWIRVSAENGCRGAQALLGEMLELGQVTPRDLDEAAEWLGMAADWGDEDAQNRLDRLMRSGVLDPRTRDRIDLLDRDPVSRRILH